MSKGASAWVFGGWGGSLNTGHSVWIKGQWCGRGALNEWNSEMIDGELPEWEIKDFLSYSSIPWSTGLSLPFTQHLTLTVLLTGSKNRALVTATIGLFFWFGSFHLSKPWSWGHISAKCWIRFSLKPAKKSFHWLQLEPDCAFTETL